MGGYSSAHEQMLQPYFKAVEEDHCRGRPNRSHMLAVGKVNARIAVIEVFRTGVKQLKESE